MKKDFSIVCGIFLIIFSAMLANDWLKAHRASPPPSQSPRESSRTCTSPVTVENYMANFRRLVKAFRLPHARPVADGGSVNSQGGAASGGDKESLASRASQSPEINYLEKGRDCFHNRDYHNAAINAEIALELLTRNNGPEERIISARELLASSCFKEKEYATALKHYDILRTKYPLNRSYAATSEEIRSTMKSAGRAQASEKLASGWKDYHNGDYYRAYDLATEALDLFAHCAGTPKETAGAQALLGLCCSRQGNNEQARNHLRKAVSLDPLNSTYRSALGSIPGTAPAAVTAGSPIRYSSGTYRNNAPYYPWTGKPVKYVSPTPQYGYPVYAPTTTIYPIYGRSASYGAPPAGLPCRSGQSAGYGTSQSGNSPQNEAMLYLLEQQRLQQQKQNQLMIDNYRQQQELRTRSQNLQIINHHYTPLPQVNPQAPGRASP
jgi:tetratricopeptide (TPR) repeat protein